MMDFSNSHGENCMSDFNTNALIFSKLLNYKMWNLIVAVSFMCLILETASFIHLASAGVLRNDSGF